MDRFVVESGRCEIILGMFIIIIFLTVWNGQLSMNFSTQAAHFAFISVTHSRNVLDKMLIRTVYLLLKKHNALPKRTDNSIHTFSIDDHDQ